MISTNPAPPVPKQAKANVLCTKLSSWAKWRGTEGRLVVIIIGWLRIQMLRLGKMAVCLPFPFAFLECFLKGTEFLIKAKAI
jgi:hypothetical protein